MWQRFIGSLLGFAGWVRYRLASQSDCCEYRNRVKKSEMLLNGICWGLLAALCFSVIHGCNVPNSTDTLEANEETFQGYEEFPHSVSESNLVSNSSFTPITALNNNQTDEASFVPLNSHLADSPWPIFHRNTYAQASTPLRGIEPQDELDIDILNTDIGGTSPWTQLSEAYPDGTRVVWGATLTHVFKATANRDPFELIDSYRIDRNVLSNHWGLFILSDNKIIVPDPSRRKIYKFSEEDPSDWHSKIILEDTFDLPDSIPGRTSNVNVTYDGWLVFLTRDGYFGAVSPDFSYYKSFKIPLDDEEINFHNGMALDETGGVYIVTTDRMLRVDWRNQDLSLGWSVLYDFRGPGCANISRNILQELFAVINGDTCTGSGTTPTLMGTGDDDKLVLVADGHSPSNRLIAFWRDTIPTHWAGIPGYDRRIAAITPLPYSTPDGDGFTAENSPTVHGYDVAIAQYNGFKPSCDPVKGLQKLRWNPDAHSLDLMWVNDNVNFNNVPTYSRGSNLVYGTGRRNCIYYLWGLNWDTGNVDLEIPLGDSPDYLDQGNQVTINDDRTTFFASFTGLVRIRPE